MSDPGERRLNRPEVPTPSGEVTTIVKGAGIVFLGIIASSGLKYLFEFIVARQLGPALFGVFFLGFTVFKMLERISTLELTSGMLRFVALYRGEGDAERIKGTVLSGLRIALLAAATTSFLLLLFSGSWSRRVFHSDQLSPVLKLLAVGVIFTAASEIFVYSLQALGSVKYRVWVRMIFEPGLSILLVLAFLSWGWGLSGAVLAFLIPVILGAFLAFWFIKKTYPPLVQKDVAAASEAKKLLSFSIPLFLAGLLNLFMLQINPLMLGYFRPSEEVGVFAAALRTSLLLPLVLDSFNAIFAPMIADLSHRRALKKLEELFKIVTKWIFTLSFPGFLILVLYGREILSLWGRSYTEGLATLIVLCAGQLVNCATGPVGYMISMSGRTKISLANTSGVLVLNILLNILLIPRYGIMGSAAALSLSLSLINLIRLVEVRLILKIHPYRPDFLKPLSAGILAFLVLFLAETSLLKRGGMFWSMGMGIFLFLGCYTGILAVLGIGAEEKLVFRKVKQKIFSSIR
jgi:O-antigen/teichoic acid export membrane protein